MGCPLKISGYCNTDIISLRESLQYLTMKHILAVKDVSVSGY